MTRMRAGPETGAPGEEDGAGPRRRVRVGRVAVVLYLALLGASHGVRSQRPGPEPRPGQSVQRVEGWPGPREGGVSVAYREWVTDSGGNLSQNLSQGEARAQTPSQPVLLLHGSPGSGSAFRALGPELAAAGRAIAPDLPGFGGSTARVPDYSIRAHAAVVLQLLDSLAIERAHVVGFSMGGGVALEMYGEDPARIASLTLLSSIGVQEHELLGEYYLNHAIHGLQLFAIWSLLELVPHFGLADDGFLGHAYARNFYDTDQRPLREILRGYAGPMLIVHGTDDPLVPVAAALEHHRIVPQSELVMLDGDHFMTFLRPALIARPVRDFMLRAESGAAMVRSSAGPARIAAASVPYDPAAASPATGFALFVTLLLIVVATFVSEDLTCIGTGLLIARGSLPWAPGVIACLAGIAVGDLLLYAGGRLVGRPVTRIAPFRWLIRHEELERACRWFTERSAALILGGRFVPGTRLPTYVAAGVVRMPLLRFTFWILVAAALWTPLLVGGTALFGTAAANRIGAFQDRALPWLVVSALAALVALRVLVPLFSADGRRRSAASWSRLWRWEFWPPLIFYRPVVACVLWLGLRHRSLTLFTAANPAIPDGGFVGESKSRILAAIGDRARVAETWRMGVDTRPMRVPVVVKPDVGERGAGVAIVRSRRELAERLAAPGPELIVQEYVPGEELGVFYYRIPGDERGHIFGITEKYPPVVTGDGRQTIGSLILDDKRLRCQRRMFARQLGAAVDRVPGAGERVTLEERGNHCFGCEFRDGSHIETPALAAAIEEVSRSIDGFYFGRYDIRGKTLDDIQAGRFKVIELNGVSSEATNIYDPRNTLFSAYGTLFRQWKLAFRIGAANRARGVEPSRLLPLLGRLVRHFRPSGARWHANPAPVPSAMDEAAPATSTETG